MLMMVMVNDKCTAETHDNVLANVLLTLNRFITSFRWFIEYVLPLTLSRYLHARYCAVSFNAFIHSFQVNVCLYFDAFCCSQLFFQIAQVIEIKQPVFTCYQTIKA